MSKYTTELRYLVDQGFDFQLTEYPLFDESYRATLNKKILDHYRYREIGFETPARFRHQLKTKLNEIMPFYNKMYESELLVINPLYTVDYTETSTKETDGTSVLEGSATTDRDSTTNIDNVQTNNLTDAVNMSNTTTHNLNEATESQDDLLSVDSDAPAGMIAVGDLKSNTYASTSNMQDNARTGSKLTTGTVGDQGTNTTTRTGSVTDDGSTVLDETITNAANSTTTINSLDDYVKHVVGHMGGKSHSELLEDFRKTFLNIDLQIIRDLNILFMGVY